MAYSSRFIYTRVLGTLGNSGSGIDTWGVGWKIPFEGSVTGAALTSYLTAISTPVATFHGNTSLKAGTTCFVKTLTAAYIGEDGKYVGGGAQATTVYTYGTPVAGTGTAASPFSTAVVISLRTQFSRGRASNGRLYWPAVAQQIDGTTGGIGSTLTGNIANAAKTMLDAVNSAAASAFSTTNKVSVMSQVGAGTLAPVTHVRVGQRLDRQERREDGVPEAYSTSALASLSAFLDDLADTPIGSVRDPRV